MTADSARAGAGGSRVPLVLPSGQGRILCAIREKSGRVSGQYAFRGRDLSLQVDLDAGVLFPTDVGLSLLAAIQDERSVNLAGVRVLDVGAGSGLYTVAFLTAGAAQVTALDLNPGCARVVSENVTRNGLDRSRLRCVTADLRDLPKDSGHDLIVCNPPHFPYDAAYASGDGLEAALVGGEDGRALYDILISRVDDLLAPGGTLLLAHSSLTDIARTRRELAESGYSCRTLQVCEMDIPMLRYADHRDLLLARLYRLRAQGRAAFTGLRFEVHILAFTRPTERC